MRVRGAICQTCAATGRLAMEEPNLQTVPKPRRFNVRATQTQVSAGGTTGHRREPLDAQRVEEWRSANRSR